MLVWSNLRWSRAIATLEQAPGIVIVDADRGWNSLRLTGLRDPLSANPSALLAARGLDTSAIEAHWEPYVSAQPQIVLERARRLLAAPAGVSLAVTGDTLVVRGRASRDWRERNSALASTLPGVSHVDMSEIADAFPGELDSLVRQAQEIRVLFSPGSDSLDASGTAATDSLAAHLIRLSAAAVREGYGMAVMLVGRTDSLGPGNDAVGAEQPAGRGGARGAGGRGHPLDWHFRGGVRLYRSAAGGGRGLGRSDQSQRVRRDKRLRGIAGTLG